MRIVFMGTGEIAIPTVKWLLDQHVQGQIELVAVYTQPDKPVGRKQVLTPPEIKVLAEEQGIPVFQPERLRGNAEALGQFAQLSPDLAVVMAYGQILPLAIIETPALACVNLHASLLPRFRGAAPIQAAIREGDEETGITLMHIVPKLDAGDMILKESLAILPEDTGGTLHDRLAELGPSVLEAGLERFRRGNVAGVVQDEALVTHTGKLGREDGRLDWTQDAATLARTIRAYDPWPGTTTTLGQGDDQRILKVYPFAIPQEGREAAPGTVLETGASLLVQCGSGALELRGDLQLEGRRRLAIQEFLKGSPIAVGTILGE